MGKNDQPSTLEELGLGETFDCSKFGSRSFAIEEKYLHVLGYSLDRSGSQAYLQDTLEQLKEVNSGVQCLVPLHADGDGHCLVHAISRCVVGRDLFVVLYICNNNMLVAVLYICNNNNLSYPYLCRPLLLPMVTHINGLESGLTVPSQTCEI